jgi:hypothetical protein
VYPGGYRRISLCKPNKNLCFPKSPFSYLSFAQPAYIPHRTDRPSQAPSLSSSFHPNKSETQLGLLRGLKSLVGWSARRDDNEAGRTVGALRYACGPCEGEIREGRIGKGRILNWLAIKWQCNSRNFPQDTPQDTPQYLPQETPRIHPRLDLLCRDLFR